MRTIRLLDLGAVSPLRSQTVYHAVASALNDESPSTIILVTSDRPYVCIGYHQELDKEVDVDYCREAGLPVYRREVGGGAVYLDSNQLFAQWVFRPDALPQSLEDRYALYVRPLVETYQSLGVPAYYRPVNDIHVAGKKIGGTGAARIGPAEVLVGSIMFDFDKAAMARVLKVSSEKMRDKVHESLAQYMTTLAEQLPGPPDRRQVQSLYLSKAAAALDATLAPGELTAAEADWARRLDEQFVSREWLERVGNRRRDGVRIQADAWVGESAVKAPGGLVRATVRVVSGRVDDLTLSGDFMMFPGAAAKEIEARCRGARPQEAEIAERVAAVYAEWCVESPGLERGHVVSAITAAAATAPS